MAQAYDAVVIGAGGGGYPAALRLVRAGRTVLMVDPKGNLGGNCLFEGCVPSKAVREAASLKSTMERADFFGLEAVQSPAAWSRVVAYKDGVQTRRYAQHRQEVEQARGLTLVSGLAGFVDANRVRVQDLLRQEEFTVSGRHIIVATGSEAAHLPIAGFDSAWNHHDFFAWKQTQPTLPEDIVILGGGYIGAETASMLADLGVKVTLLELMPEILSGMDQDLARAVREGLQQRVTVVTGVEVTGIEPDGGHGYVVAGRRTADGTALSYRAQRVMAAAGRVPHVPSDLGLERAGVAYDRRGIAVDAHMRTGVPHILAPGDVNGESMLFHSAVAMSEVAARTILEGPEAGAPWLRDAPATVFTRPEAMTVGLTAEAARRQGLAVWEETRPMGVEAWAQIRGETEGFVKLTVGRATGRIVGMHAVGVDAAALSAAAHMAVRLGLTPGELGSMVFAHPTQFEALDRLARGASSDSAQ